MRKSCHAPRKCWLPTAWNWPLAFVTPDTGLMLSPALLEESVTGMRGVIAGLTPADSGTFQRYDGGTIEW